MKSPLIFSKYRETCLYFHILMFPLLKNSIYLNREKLWLIWSDNYSKVNVVEHNDIITYKEEAILMVDDKAAWDLILDVRYQPIIEALRKGPMTVKDLEMKYNQIVAKKIDEMPLDAKEKKELKQKTRRKGKTLYKYLDSLEKMGLVVQAGKRVKMGQTASETLYGRSAKLFIKSDEKKEELYTKEIKKALPVLGRIISLEREQEERERA